MKAVYECIYVHMYSPTAPSGPPTLFVASSIGAEGAMLSWSLPEQESRNGIINDYSVHCREDSGSTVLNVTTKDMDIFIRNLRAAVLYECKVSAFTVAGGGPWAFVNFTTMSDGNAVKYFHELAP